MMSYRVFHVRPSVCWTGYRCRGTYLNPLPCYSGRDTLGRSETRIKTNVYFYSRRQKPNWYPNWNIRGFAIEPLPESCIEPPIAQSQGLSPSKERFSYSYRRMSPSNMHKICNPLKTLCISAARKSSSFPTFLALHSMIPLPTLWRSVLLSGLRASYTSILTSCLGREVFITKKT